MNRVILFLLLVGAVISCEKTEIPTIENSGILALGDQTDLELVTIKAHPDGGFLVGANSRITQNQKMRVMKFNSDFGLEWEQIVGGNFSNKLFDLFVDKDQHILVVGLSFGFGNDTFPTAAHRFWRAYANRLTPTGESLWEKDLEVTNFAGAGSGLIEGIKDIAQNSDGDYLICGEFASSTTSIRGTLIKLSVTGEEVSRNVNTSNRQAKFEAVFERNNDYIVFNYLKNSDTSEALANVLLHKTLRAMVDNSHHDSISTSWPWSSGYENGHVGGVKKVLKNGDLSYCYVFPNSAYRYAYHEVNKTLQGRNVAFEYSNISNAEVAHDGRFLLTSTTGDLYETDEDFKLINSFSTGWQVKRTCKLHNGDYIIGSDKKKIIYLIHFDKNGKVKNDE